MAVAAQSELLDKLLGENRNGDRPDAVLTVRRARVDTRRAALSLSPRSPYARHSPPFHAHAFLGLP